MIINLLILCHGKYGQSEYKKAFERRIQYIRWYYITLKLNYSHKNKEEWKQEFYSRLCCIFKVNNWVSWSVVLKQKAQI